MTASRLFRLPVLGVFVLFAVIACATSALSVYTVDNQLEAQYEANSVAIAHTIAESSLDMILNRDMSTLQSLIDQFREIQGIKYLYIANEEGEIVAHTFVPGIPKELDAIDRKITGTFDRKLSGVGEFVEVSSPILDGIAGSVHVGMDKGLIALKIQTAIGQQMYLISSLFIVSIVLSFLLLQLAAKPIGRLREIAETFVAEGAGRTVLTAEMEALLARRDEVGDIARQLHKLALQRNAGGASDP